MSNQEYQMTNNNQSQSNNPKLPIGWQEVKLGDIVDINTETLKPTNKKLKIKYVDIASVEAGKINNIQELEIKDAPSRAKRIVKDNTILISTVRPNLRHYCFVKNSQENLIASTGFAVIESQKADPKFIYYFITTDDYTEHLTKIADGHTATYPSFNPDVIQKSKIQLPPLPEQQAIAAILSSLDDKIELLRDQNKTLEELGQKLFQKELAENGDDWEEKRLGEVVDIKYGKNLPTNNLTNLGFPVFGANGQVGYYDKFHYQEQQVLISCRGEKSGVVNISSPQSFVTNNSLILEKNKELKSFAFLKNWALNYNFMSFVSGSAQPQITIESLNNAIIKVPDAEFELQFEKIHSPIIAKILANTQQIQTLSKTRDTLLPQLMSGRVRVGVEKI